jgi:hypothetical protein
MKNEDIDWGNPFEVWKFLTQPSVERLPNETDEHYRERLLQAQFEECE